MGHLFPNSRILSVEPGSNNYHVLSLNTALHPRIHTVYGAVWGEPGFLTMWGDDWGSRTWSLSGSPKNVQKMIPANSVVGLMRKYRMPQVDILKVDVEGSEVALFKSVDDVAFLKSVKCIVTEWHFWNPKAKAHWPVFQDIMKAYGFRNVPRSRASELRIWCRHATLR